MKALVEVVDLRHALHAAAAAAVHRLDDQIAAALDGDALQCLRRRDFARTTAPARRLRRSSASSPACRRRARPLARRDAGQAQALRHRGGRDRRIGGDADHAVDLADLAAVAFGGGGGFRRRHRRRRSGRNRRTQSRALRDRGRRRRRIGPSPWRAWRRRPLRCRRKRSEASCVPSEIQPAIDVDGLRRDVGRRVAGQEHDRVGDFLRACPGA